MPHSKNLILTETFDSGITLSRCWLSVKIANYEQKIIKINLDAFWDSDMAITIHKHILRMDTRQTT